MNVVVHVVELSVEPLEAHDLVGDLLRQGSDRRVLDVAKQVLDADLLSFFGSNFGLKQKMIETIKNEISMALMADPVPDENKQVKNLIF